MIEPMVALRPAGRRTVVRIRRTRRTIRVVRPLSSRVSSRLLRSSHPRRRPRPSRRLRRRPRSRSQHQSPNRSRKRRSILGLAALGPDGLVICEWGRSRVSAGTPPLLLCGGCGLAGCCGNLWLSGSLPQSRLLSMTALLSEGWLWCPHPVLLRVAAPSSEGATDHPQPRWARQLPSAGAGPNQAAFLRPRRFMVPAVASSASKITTLSFG